MEKRQLAEKLASLTATLQPGRGASADDLRTVRHLLAHSLAREGLIAHEGAESILEGSLTRAALHELEELPQDELEEVAAAALRSREEGAPPLPEAAHVSHRTVPFLTSTHAMSVPSWAAGRRVDRTLGPFIDRHGRPHWFDIYVPVRQIAMVRSPSPEPILLLPFQGFSIRSAARYDIPAGSIWIRSRLLDASAPAGAYTGLRVKGGTLTLSSPPGVSGDRLQIGHGVKVTVELELDPSEPQPPTSNLAGDARESESHVPATVVFVFTASGCQLVKAADAAMVAYENGFELAYRPGAPAYEPLLNRILLPFDTEQTSIEIGDHESEVFFPRGVTAVTGAAWAVPVTVAPPDSLGEASEAGALVLRLEPGLQARWRGLEGGPVRLGAALLMTQPDRLVLVTPDAVNPAAIHNLLVWQVGPAMAPSQVSMAFSRPFTLRFISLAGTNDTLLVEAELEAGLDRPLQASGARIPLRSSAAPVAFWQDANGFWVLILTALEGATPSPELKPFAMALTNALLRVWPPLGLLVFGAMLDPNSVHSGILAVLFRLSTLIPTLRDPYVSNMPLMRRRPLSHGPSASALAHLLAVVGWKGHANPRLSMLLLPSTTGTGHQATASASNPANVASNPGTADSGGNPNRGVEPSLYDVSTFVMRFRPIDRDPAEIAAQDAAAESELRSVFERVAGLSREQVVLVDVSTNTDQFGVGFGVSRREQAKAGGGSPLQIRGLDLVTAGRNVRIFLLPLVQWEPVVTVQNPDVGYFPSPVASPDDGGPSVIGARSVTLVPIAPDDVVEQIVGEFGRDPGSIPAAALFTLPFGMKAAAQFQPRSAGEEYWATLDLNRPKTSDDRFLGGLQLSAQAFRQTAGPDVESPSFPGAAYQTRNLIDPDTLVPLGLSVLSSTVGKGVDEFFNDEMWPGGTEHRPRVPVTRIDFAGYGASMFSDWANPNAVAAISQTRFDVMVGRTAHEVVQVRSTLYPWAVPVVRTITLQRRREGVVIRKDSGWLAAGPGLYRYPDPDPEEDRPTTWSEIRTHPGVVGGVYNVRRIRETGRIVTRQLPTGDPTKPTVTVELLEVRFDGDFQIEDVVSGQGSDGRVTGQDHVGFVQSMPKGYPMMPEHFAAILEDEGPIGGPLDCWFDIGNSGQMMHVARVDVAAAPPSPSGLPQFAAAARGSLSLPSDGAWSVLRHDLSQDEPQPVHPDSGVSLVRQGTPSPTGSYRIAEPGDLLRTSPAVDFGLVQSSAGHQVMFPRPKIEVGERRITSTQRPFLADAWALSTATGVFPRPATCFVGQTTYELDIGVDGRYTLGPSATMAFQIPPAVGDRALVDTSAFGITTHYEGDVRYTLDPTHPSVWSMAVDKIKTSMDLGPFDDLMGIQHHFRVGEGQLPVLIEPVMVYAPALDPVVKILRVLTELLGVDSIFDVLASLGSFKFKATLNLPIEDPTAADGYFTLGAMRIKGKLQVGVSNSPEWNGFMQIGLGAQVPVVPPILGGGEVAVKLKGNELTEQKVTIMAKWGGSISQSLGPISVSGSFSFGIIVVVSTTGGWTIGLMVGVAGSADIWIVKITVKLELMAAITRLPPPPVDSGKTEAIGQATFAAEVTVCWFLTISVEYSLQYKEEIDI